jgi:hypothetical protein
MRTTTPLIIILLILTGCYKETSDDKTLVFPTGGYTNWTNYELIHMAFKLQDAGLAIDNNYDFESKTFKSRGFEKITDYPATTGFLKKTLDEYQTLSQTADTTHCGKLTPIYIEYKNGNETDLISFKTIGECTSIDTLSGIANELWALRQKYAR